MGEYSEMMPKTPRAFELMDGEIRVWIEQESIHLLACGLKYRDPVELTPQHARELANKLLGFADLVDV